MQEVVPSEFSNFLIIYKRLRTNAWADFNAICKIYKADIGLFRTSGTKKIFKAVSEFEALELRKPEK